MSQQVQDAISDAMKVGRAICKFITPNDVGANGSHQQGYYLPKSEWQMFTPWKPEKGVNHESIAKVVWPEGIETESAVKWYGVGTRAEFRLTRFGRNFPWMKETCVGALLVVVPFSHKLFHAYVFELEEEIEMVQAALGVETLGSVGVFNQGVAKLETEDECLDRMFSKAIEEVDSFPPGDWMANQTRAAVDVCTGSKIQKIEPDRRLLKWVKAEYQLFRTLEKKLCLPTIKEGFNEVESFISLAATIMNRRKSRAGFSLEHHVEHLLESSGLKFDRQPRIDGKVRPDLLMPGKAAYEDPSFPVDRLMVVGIKTTCKDRWRQILNEGKRVPEKHLLTLQEGISSDQLVEMKEAKVTLVVPKEYHSGYNLKTGIQLLSIEQFMNKVQSLAA